MSGFSVFVLNLSKSGNILFRKCQMKIVCSAQHVCHWNSLVHEIRVMAAVELHVNVTYYA